MPSDKNTRNFGLAVHGGVFWDKANKDRQKDFLKDILVAGHKNLADGGTALDAVMEAVRTMEDSGLYIAGKGSGPNLAGYYELDASIMDGASGRAGAVASLRRFQNPVFCARAVMENSEQVLLVAEGAENFLLRHGIPALDDPKAYFVPVDHPKTQNIAPAGHGTVGAVALDRQGRLAAATSTGGLTGKLEGRVGDTPLIGAATWADDQIAISTTGQGEYFIRAAVAHDAAARCRYANTKPELAIRQVLGRVQQMGGTGGMIVMMADGTFECGFNTTGMHRGWVRTDGKVEVENY